MPAFVLLASSTHDGSELIIHTQGVMVWQPHVRSSGEWYAAKILQGIFGAPIESLAEVTVSDVVCISCSERNCPYR